MSSHTVSTLPRISAITLSQTLLAQTQTSSNLDATTPPSKIAIVDVRDDGTFAIPPICTFFFQTERRTHANESTDHIGGHIRHSIHAPSHTLDHKIPELVRKLKDKEAVVFHCALSQQRGPSAALRYIRERERLYPSSSTKLGEGSGAGQVLKRNAEDKKGAEGEADGEWEDEDEGSTEQKVYVLDRGFVGWQERFGEDSRLTEGYRKEIWKEGYWM